jgi:hypothetical protein
MKTRKRRELDHASRQSSIGQRTLELRPSQPENLARASRRESLRTLENPESRECGSIEICRGQRCHTEQSSSAIP